MHIAHWLHIFAILGAIAFSIYFAYAVLIVRRQGSAIEQPMSSAKFYMFGGAALLLAFALWRLARAIRHLNIFRRQYDAHVAATRKA